MGRAAASRATAALGGGQILLAAIVIAGAVLRFDGLDRPGFSIDEELTYFSCQGISAHGLPVLPSGLLYRRGLLFTYLAWFSGWLFGQSVEAHRYPSLAAGLVTIVLVFGLARRATTPVGGLIAAALVAFSPVHVLADTWARPYSAFVTVLLAAMVACPGAVEGGRRRYFLAAVLAASLLHEFAAMLLLLPACHVVTGWSGSRARRAAWVTAGAALLLLASQGVVHGWLDAPAAAASLPASGARLWAVTLNAAPTAFLERASPAFLALTTGAILLASVLAWKRRLPAFVTLAAAAGLSLQFGSLALAAVAGMLAQPRRAPRYAGLALAAVAGGTAWWLVYLRAHLMPSAALSGLARSLVLHGLSHPTAAVVYLLQHFPFTLGLATAAGASAAWRFRADGRSPTGAYGVFVLCWLAALGVVQTGFEPRHLLPVTTLLLVIVAQLPDRLAASAVHGHILPAAPGPLRAAFGAVLLAAILPVLSAEQWADLRTSVAFKPAAPGWRLSSFDPSVMAPVRTSIADVDLVVCNDELSCLLGLGRVDYWLSPGSDRFMVRTEAGEYGLYGGRPALPSPEAAPQLATTAQRTVWVVLARTHKFWFPEESARLVEGGAVLIRDRPGLRVYRIAPKVTGSQ